MFAKLKSRFTEFSADEGGATAIEYGLIVGLIFLAVVTTVRNFAGETNEMYSAIDSALSDRTPPPAD